MVPLIVCILFATIGLSLSESPYGPGVGPNNYGSISPSYGRMSEGSSLTISCFINHQHIDPNAAIYFATNYNGNRQIIDPNFDKQAPIYYSLESGGDEAQLHIKRLSRNHTGMFECHANNSQTGRRDTWIESVLIDVGRLPVIHETVTVLDNFETMRISWCEAGEEDPFISIFRWAHVVEFDNVSNAAISVGNYRGCPLWIDRCTCVFSGSGKTPTLVPYSYYHIHITKRNLYGREHRFMNNYYVDHTQVQLSPIQFTSVIQTNVSVRVLWEPITIHRPNGVHLLSHTFNLYSEQGHMMVEETFITSDNQKTFKDLKPNTIYTIRAKRSVVGSSYTSQESRIKVWTKTLG